MRYSSPIKIKEGENPALTHKPHERFSIPQRHFSFFLWNGDIFSIYAKSIRLAYVQIRDEVDPNEIAFIFPYKPPLPIMLYKNTFYYWEFHPLIFKEPLFPISENTKKIIMKTFNT
jgi:hypothetical protein